MDFEKIKNHKYYFEPISLDLVDDWFINEWPNKLKEIKEYNKTDKDSNRIFYLDMIF